MADQPGGHRRRRTHPDQLGDGSVFDPMPAQGLSVEEAWRDTGTVRRLYGQSIEYTLEALLSWVVGLHDENLVLVLLGDHQPVTRVSGIDATHQVPISFVASGSTVGDDLAPADPAALAARLLP